MLTIKGGQFIEVLTTQGYNGSGQQELQLTIEGNYELIDMKTTVDAMRIELDQIKAERETEAALRKSNPALQELYDQYQVVYTLVKKADNNINSNGQSV